MDIRSRFDAGDDVRVFAAPGRVNLMGDHTDYNDGLVLPMALDRECVVGAVATTEGRVRARSLEQAGEVVVDARGHDDPGAAEPAWGRFVAGAVRALADRGARVTGADLVVSSTVPAGSGLSSSSALTVAVVLALADLAGAEYDRRAIARIALAAEVEATGVPGGLMDQLASLFGRADHALLIDCRELSVQPIPIAANVAVVVVHSGVSRTLAGSPYAERRAQCEAVARRLGVAALRDATLAQVTHEPRARHVVAENGRVLATAAALAAGDLPALGTLLLESHASLRNDYEVSTPELDLLVQLLVEAGAAGARLTGAGFGGCVVALADHDTATVVAHEAAARYATATGLTPAAFVARAANGAHRDRG